MKELMEFSWWEMLYQDMEIFFYSDIWVPSQLVQIIIILLVFFNAKFLSAYTKRLFKYISGKTGHIGGLRRLWSAMQTVSITFLWLVQQWIIVLIAQHYELPSALINTTSSLLAAWIVIRLTSQWFSNPFYSRTIAVTAWTMAALNILGLLPETLELLESISFTMGEINISLLLLLKIAILLIILMWMANAISDLIEKNLKRSSSISPAARVLISKIIRIVFLSAAVLVTIKSSGIDLTALAVFSGALAVGLGFGLQKIFSNLVSGVILLIDKSIKPGDVISLGQTYGWINHLGARYVSVITRDGTEHLIPNEELITQRVENWSHSHQQVRLRVPVGISYKSDPHLAIKLCIDATTRVPRVLQDPVPRCLLKAFGESSVDLEIRAWINDPENGRGSVISEILLEVWDLFQENNIEIPFAQRDIYIKQIPEKMAL